MVGMTAISLVLRFYYPNINMDNLYKKAIKLGGSDFGISTTQHKRFFVVYDGRIIHFGSKHAKTFIDHHDDDKRKAWIARHSKIKNKDGQYVIHLKTSPSYWSCKILW